MTDKKFTDEEILKRLAELSQYTGLQAKYTQALKAALDLINRQKAENANLLEEIKQLKLQNNLMTSERELHKIGASNLVLKIKTEAYKEFAERLKEEMRLEDDCDYNCRECYYECKDYVITIDNLLKEMVGEEE